MVLRCYPAEVQKWVDMIDPYIKNRQLDGAPAEVKEALEKFKKWAWEQDQ